MKTNKTFICPVCGAEVRHGSAACPSCGADENTGWSDKTYLDGIDVGDDIDYDDLVEKEFGNKSPKPLRKVNWVVIVAVILLLLSLGGFLRILFKL